MDETLDKLEGEGKVKIIKKVLTRKECEICGEPAHYQHTFLLPNARGNPASSGYRKDDISWCSDEKMFVCKEHLSERNMDGYEWCATFPASKRFTNLFLYWKEVK